MIFEYYDYVLKLSSYLILLCCLSYVHFIAVPGGSIAQDGDKPCKTNACVFEAPEDMDSMHNYEQVNFGLCVFCLMTWYCFVLTDSMHELGSLCVMACDTY